MSEILLPVRGTLLVLCVVFTAARGGDGPLAGSDPPQRSPDGDGLLEAWKTGRVHPGGLDLKALGCRLGRKDLIVEVERFEDVDFPRLRQNMERAARYLAGLPIRNRDGSRGIALHVIYREPTPRADFRKVVDHFDDLYLIPQHRGVVHTKFCARPEDGFGVPMIPGDNGRWDGSWFGFLHEMGHQFVKTDSAPGACWFRGDIVIAYRRHDDVPDRNGTLILGFHGSGILPDPMSDFNDIDYIGRIGLERALREARH